MVDLLGAFATAVAEIDGIVADSDAAIGGTDQVAQARNGENAAVERARPDDHAFDGRNPGWRLAVVSFRAERQARPAAYLLSQPPGTPRIVLVRGASPCPRCPAEAARKAFMSPDAATDRCYHQ